MHPATLDAVNAATAGLEVVELNGGAAPPADAGPAQIRLAVHRGSAPLVVPGDAFDLLLTAQSSAPSPWVSVPAVELDAVIAELGAVVARKPVAASVLAQVLRMGPRLSFAEAIVVESLAYSMLLAGSGFRAWRTATAARVRPASPGPRVRLARESHLLVVTLSAGRTSATR